MSFEERLKSLMKEKRITQNKLAEKISVSEASVHHYCRGENSPRMEILIELAQPIIFWDFLILRNTRKMHRFDMKDLTNRIISIVLSAVKLWDVMMNLQRIDQTTAQNVEQNYCIKKIPCNKRNKITDCKTKEDQQMLDQNKHYLDWPLQLYALQEAEFQLRSCLEEKEQVLVTEDVIC